MDYEVHDLGSLVQIAPLTVAAAEWIDENVAAEPWQFMGRTLCIDHRCAGDVLFGMQEAGLTSNVTVEPA